MMGFGITSPSDKRRFFSLPDTIFADTILYSPAYHFIPLRFEPWTSLLKVSSELMGSSNSTLLPLWRTISKRKAIPTPLNKLKEAYKVLYIYTSNRIDYAKCSLFEAFKKCSFDSINISANDRNSITPYTLYIME